MPNDFQGAFADLRRILKRQARGLVVHADSPSDFSVLSPAIGPNGKPLWFGAVLLKKSAVTFHLMPLYFNPNLQAEVPPELLARKQGKTCFNFQRPDQELFSKLDALTQRARALWERLGLLQPGPVAQDRFDSALRAGGEDPPAIARKRKAGAKHAAAKRAATKRKAARG